MPSTLMLLSNPYRPDPRVQIEARVLKGAGIGVRLIAWDREGTYPDTEGRPEIDITRVGPKCPLRSALKVATRLPRFWLNALSKARTLEFDLVHAHDFDTLPLGMLISRLGNKKLLYDAHEVYSAMTESEAGALSRLVWKLERTCVRAPDEVITVSSSLADRIGKYRGGDIHIVTTSPDPSEMLKGDRLSLRTKYGFKGFVISYLGALEPGRFIEDLLTCFTPSDNVTLVIAGWGTLEQKVADAAAANPIIRYIGRVDSDEALRLTWASDLTIAMMDPTNPNNLIGTPGKIVNSLAVGIPVITTQGVQIADRIDSAGAGIVVPFDRAKFIEAVIGAAARPKNLEDMGRKGRQLYEREFSAKQSSAELLAVYHRILRSENGTGSRHHD